MDDELNDPQAEAVAHIDGPLLVFAGAGSGKTRVITYRIANLVATHHVPPYRILAVTFTNKAAGEMRERLRHLLGDDVAKDLWVGTFHATCARLLRRHHNAVGLGRDFVIYDDADQRSLINRIVKEMKLDDKRYPPRMLLSLIHSNKQEGRGPCEMNVANYLEDVAVKVYSAYEQHLRSSNACDFDDLLLHILRLVERRDPELGDELSFPPPEIDLADEAGAAIRRQFKYVLVDEFQDTNAVQYRLVRAMVRAHGNLAVVGDDDQSIYSWRGADVRNIRGYSDDFPDARVVRLEQNYRSTKRIVRAALGVIAPSPQRVPKDLWSDNAEGDKIEIRACNDERDEAAKVVSTIRAWGEEWSRKEIAVLYRTHAQSRVLEEAMRGGRIPYKIIGGLKFFDRAEIKDLLSYLRLTVNPRSDVDLLRVINTPTRGIGDTTVDRVQAAANGQPMLDTVRAVASGKLEAGVAQAARKKLGAFVEILDDLQKHLPVMTPADLASYAVERSGYAGMLQAEGTAEATTREENLAELIGSIRDYEAAAQASGGELSLAGFLEKTALINVGDDIKTDDAVTLMTVHAAKGLEYRGVMIVGLEDELFPNKGFKTRDQGDDDRSTEADDDLEEERRLAYVAITRAREKLVLSYAAQRTLYGQTRYNRPSRFLKDLPKTDVVQSGGRSDSYAPRGWGNAPSPGERQQPKRGEQEWRHPMWVSNPPRSVERTPGERFVERDDGESPLRRGTRVRHKKFGEGSVVSIVEGPEPMVIAEFPGWGQMTILQRFIQVVDR